MNKTRQIEVGGKKYTLTCRRSIVFDIAKVCPELIKIIRNNDVQEVSLEDKIEAGKSIYDHIDVIFYEMIKIAHKDITKEKSDEIYEAFYDEYDDVDESIIKFFTESFSEGIPTDGKKKLNW